MENDNGCKCDVFISYSRKDYVDEKGAVIEGNVISKILESFESSNITYWIDKKGVYVGDEYMEKIADAIAASSILLFVSSVNSNASEWTPGEIGTAHLYKKKIIPFRLDDTPYARSFIVKVASLNYIDYFGKGQEAIDELIAAIQAYKEELARRIEEERQKAEEERRWKEREEKNRKEAQRQNIARIEAECRRLNNEEKKIELDRDTLIHSTETITDEKEREDVKLLIASSSPLRKKVEEEMETLRKKAKMMEEKADRLDHEIDELNSKRRDLEHQLAEKEKRITELQSSRSQSYDWYYDFKKKEKEAERYKDWYENACDERSGVILLFGIILFLLISTGVFFWLHGNMKFFFPREPRVKTEVPVEAEMDSCFVGKSAEELHNESWNYLYGNNGKPQDTAMAFKYMKASAELGYDLGMNGLGRFYEEGWGVEQNYEEAVKWYREAEKKGEPNAQNNLGRMYDNGWGVEQNMEEAVKWYRKSAEQGNLWGQYDLGLKYQYGGGVEKDTVEAIKWYKMAAAQGNENAKNKLKELGVSEE